MHLTIHTDRTDRTDDTNRTDRTDRTERTESTERTDGTDGTDRTDHMDRTVLTDMAIVNALDDPLIKGHVIGDVWITEIRSTMASIGNKPGRVTRDVTSVS